MKNVLPFTKILQNSVLNLKSFTFITRIMQYFKNLVVNLMNMHSTIIIQEEFEKFSKRSMAIAGILPLMIFFEVVNQHKQTKLNRQD